MLFPKITILGKTSGCLTTVQCIFYEYCLNFAMALTMQQAVKWMNGMFPAVCRPRLLFACLPVCDDFFAQKLICNQSWIFSKIWRFRLIFKATNSCKTQNLTPITCQGNLIELTSWGVSWVNGWEITDFLERKRFSSASACMVERCCKRIAAVAHIKFGSIRLPLL